MKKTINGDSQPIKNIETYNKMKSYTSNYIRKLLVNPKIRRKDSLQLVLNDLNNFGYISDGWKFSFLMRLVMFEPEHKNTDIGTWIFDLQRFKRQHEYKISHSTLESFLV